MRVQTVIYEYYKEKQGNRWGAELTDIHKDGRHEYPLGKLGGTFAEIQKRVKETAAKNAGLKAEDILLLEYFTPESLNQKRREKTRSLNMSNIVLPLALDEKVRNGEIEPPEDWDEYPEPGDVMAVARRFLNDCYTVEYQGREIYTLLHWNGSFWEFKGDRWEKLDTASDLKWRFYARVDNTIYLDPDTGQLKTWQPTRNQFFDVADALEALLYVRAEIPVAPKEAE